MHISLNGLQFYPAMRRVCDGFFICGLSGCETGSVDAVVDGVIDPGVHFVDLGEEGGRK